MELEEDDYLVPWDKPRTLPKCGDFFALRTGRGLTLLGRVASIGTRLAPDEPKSMDVVYIYSPDVPVDPLPACLPVSRIWIGPIKVMPQLWSQRYFKRVGRRPWLPGELLKSHLFWMGKPEEIRDEHGELATGELPERLGLAYVNPPFGVAEAIKFRLAGDPDLHEPPI